MIPGSLARRYASALLGLSTSPMQRDKFARDLSAIAELARARDEAGKPVLAILSAERFSSRDRKKLIGSLASRTGTDVDPMVIRFLEHIIDKGRMEGLLEINRAYERMADEAAGRIQAHITSASPLTPDAVGRIKAALEQATGKTVVASISVDPELIGGIVARVGSYLIDGSVRSSLQQLRASLRS
jgi:F-type H+-transporting ATPase subunit delta